ncbi:MAG: class I SAM-dependent methyltransferase [Candidatus Omnitrophica bacterium]|nr:class I SAM-dependent methyltransferase [Candidatus Omnitrophota bacterium]
MKKNCLFIILLFSLSWTLFAQNDPSRPQKFQNTGEYNFSSDWVSVHVPVWKKFLDQYKGEPKIRYLEIGVFEGRSLIWMLENILTHPSATATGIDPFYDPYHKTCLTNLNKSGLANKTTLIAGKSQEKLRDLPLSSFDIIYVDGSHTSQDVATDVTLGWMLLKNGGIMILDDYGWSTGFPEDLNPRIAIDCFITTHRNEMEVLHQDFQVLIRKKQNENSAILRVGPYEYRRGFNPKQKGRLFYSESGNEIKLSNAELELLERLFNERTFGRVKFSPADTLLNNKDFQQLKKKLDNEAAWETNRS